MNVTPNYQKGKREKTQTKHVCSKFSNNIMKSIDQKNMLTKKNHLFGLRFAQNRIRILMCLQFSLRHRALEPSIIFIRKNLFDHHRFRHAINYVRFVF